MVFIVAIDGPAGSGKSSVAKTVARNLGFTYVDTGAIYRTLAFAALENQVSLDDVIALVALAQSLDVAFKPDIQGQQVIFQGNDISKLIRSEKISQLASVVSRYAEVRSSLLELQRRLACASPNGAVLEGRDIGTVVFPKAHLKFFLTASDEKRAERRFLELKEQGEEVFYDAVLAEIQQRDRRDKERAVAPLTPAEDAILIDTTQYAKQDVIHLIESTIQAAFKENK